MAVIPLQDLGHLREKFHKGTRRNPAVVIPTLSPKGKQWCECECCCLLLVGVLHTWNVVTMSQSAALPPAITTAIFLCSSSIPAKQGSAPSQEQISKGAAVSVNIWGSMLCQGIMADMKDEIPFCVWHFIKPLVPPKVRSCCISLSNNENCSFQEEGE